MEVNKLVSAFKLGSIHPSIILAQLCAA